MLTWPGKKEDGTGGDILLWKRKAEMYLIEKAKANPSLSWTIIHPGTSWPRLPSTIPLNFAPIFTPSPPSHPSLLSTLPFSPPHLPLPPLTYLLGGLLDKPGGVRELVLDVNDTLLSRTTRSIPRADVAELCVQTLMHDDAKNR
jgi:hypothetical protein